MEPQFKSSFIPKKPVAPVSMRQTRAKPVGFLFVAASIILIACVAMAAGIFGYGMYLQKNLTQKQDALKIAQRDLQPALVQEIRRLDARLRHAKQLLSNHLALSPVFTLLEKSTLTSVQFTNFNYVFNPEGGVTLELSGIAPSFGALALQSDVLYRDPTYTTVEFTTVNLDAEGNVVFDLSLDIDAAVAGYRNLIMTSDSVEETMAPADVPAATTTVPAAIPVNSSTQP